MYFLNFLSDINLLIKLVFKGTCSLFVLKVLFSASQPTEFYGRHILLCSCVKRSCIFGLWIPHLVSSVVLRDDSEVVE